jgi:hypothetical protein
VEQKPQAGPEAKTPREELDGAVFGWGELDLTLAVSRAEVDSQRAGETKGDSGADIVAERTIFEDACLDVSWNHSVVRVDLRVRHVDQHFGLREKQAGASKDINCKTPRPGLGHYSVHMKRLFLVTETG